MNIKLINLVQILENISCIEPVNDPGCTELCATISCRECPATIRDRDNTDRRVKAVRGIINEQGVE